MKTIKELRQNNEMSTILYKGIMRNVSFSMTSYGKKFDSKEINELTPKDILDMYDDSEILKWRGISVKSLNELKSLA